MKTKQALFLGVAGGCFRRASDRVPEHAGRGQPGASDIGGVVTGPNGPEAGVW